MDLTFIEQLLDLVARSPISELELARDGWRIRLLKGAQPTEEVVETARAAAPLASTPPGVPVAVGGPHTVKAGLTGTFYRAPSPGQPPFASVGDVVDEGQTLGILEAMKTLIQIEADRGGRIAAILQDDGAPVQTGAPLFSIELTDRA